MSERPGRHSLLSQSGVEENSFHGVPLHAGRLTDKTLDHREKCLLSHGKDQTGYNKLIKDLKAEESRKEPIPARRSRTMDTPSPGSRSPVSNANLLPPFSQNMAMTNKFVLIVGDSHLRALVDGLVDMPEGCLSFGFMLTPGASASQLRNEVQHAVLPRIPEAVCLLAPSNNLTASRTVDEAAIDFAKLLTTVRNRWPKEFHRVAARIGVKYSSVAEHFLLTQLELWSRKDGVHLSDHEGMGILAQLLWSATMQQLETPPPAPQVSQPGKPSQSQQQEKECSFPLNPVWFSSATLRAMEEVSPSTLSCPVDCQPSPKPKRVASSAPAKCPRTPHTKRSSVNNMAKTTSPAGPSWTIMDAACDSPSPPKVKLCKRGKYSKDIKVSAACFIGNYVHFCDNDCSSSCSVPPERLVEWICHTCDNHLTRGKPTIAVANNLELAPIPPELAALNVLERQLIAKILPFAKIIALPKGRQRAVHGAVVCVPSEVAATVNTLPRPNTEAQLLQVKLKRHIKYKGYHFYTINMKNVLAGLAKLKEIHSEYKDVSIDECATFESLHQDSTDEEDSQLINAEAAQPEQVVEYEIDLEDVFKSEK
ncbi:hypothetical protein D5F01_LYC12227 [Larimichthys crocea]|uniref:DUF6570 domain-containing protein n=1 Tax=Larimichthys crocea TaxID=215358 RepID=A0A6G0IA03_LARCR|nr:hypothetical protein D5F01_LYC12227 [Larimichthys crocea]